MVWAETEWVEPSERRRGIIASTVLFVILGIGGALYTSGVITITSGTSSIVLAVAGLAVLIAVALSANAIHPYRRTPAVEAGVTVFHMSPAAWNIGDQVVLETSHCRKKQALAEHWRPRGPAWCTSSRSAPHSVTREASPSPAGAGGPVISTNSSCSTRSTRCICVAPHERHPPA